MSRRKGEPTELYWVRLPEHQIQLADLMMTLLKYGTRGEFVMSALQKAYPEVYEIARNAVAQAEADKEG
jgi:hypothetical protein